MIRLKVSMGNSIKCKVDPEYMISKYECNVLNTHRLNGLFDLKADKGVGVVYSGETKKSLAEKIESGIDEKSIGNYIRQIVRIILDVQKLGLDSEKLILHPEWIFLDKDESSLKMLYCPVNGAAIKYDGVLFIRELVFSTNLSGDMRQKWNRWLDETAKSGITEQRIDALSKMSAQSSSSISYKPSEIDDDGEAKTGVENPYTWGTGFEDDDFEEAATGVDQPYAWGASLDEDDEAPTGMDDDCIFSGSNMGDGTYSESTQNPFGFSGAPAKKVPQLTLLSTGESKKIMRSEFKIGRSEQRADFCIKGNSGVSNVHAIIVAKGEQYYLKDNHSTNGTYVDGMKINDSSAQVPLRNGSIIRVYNEELKFQL